MRGAKTDRCSVFADGATKRRRRIRRKNDVSIAARTARVGFALTVTMAAATLAPSSAWAQAERRDEEIVVLGRWDNPIGRSSSASQGVVGADEIMLRPRLRTGDILEVVPGLIVTQHSGTGKSNQMFLRGFNLDHGTDFATWVDGMPVNMPTHGHGQGYTDLNFLIPELVERLEYRKGAYHAEIGDFSSAGAVHLTTFRRLDEGLIKVGAGEDGYFRALAAGGAPVAAGDLVYAVQAHRYDGPWTDVSEGLDRRNALVRYSHRDDERSFDVAFMAYDADWRAADQIPRRAVDAGILSPLGSIDTTLGGETSRFSVSGSWRQALGRGRLQADAYAIDYDLELFSNFTYWLDDPIDGDQFEQRDDRRIFGGQVSFVLPAADAGTHTFGASLRYDDIDDVGLFHTTDRRRLSTVRQDAVEQHSLGLYYANERRWTERLRTILGVRADRYDFDVKSIDPANSGSASDTIVSPKANLIYALSDQVEVYASAGKGFHSNDARGTTITMDPVTGDEAERVDPLVESRGIELGVRAFTAQKLNVSAALWYLELDSELLFVGDAGNTEPSRASRRYGLELPLYYRLNDRVTFDLELALTESEFTEDDPAGSEIPGSIDRVVSAGIAFEQPRGWYGSARIRYFGPRPLIEDGSIESKSSTVVNAALGMRLGKLDLRLDVLNLFDSDDEDIAYFYASRLPGEPAQGVEDVHFHPIEPRTVRLHVSYGF